MFKHVERDFHILVISIQMARGRCDFDISGKRKAATRGSVGRAQKATSCRSEEEGTTFLLSEYHGRDAGTKASSTTDVVSLHNALEMHSRASISLCSSQ